MIPNQPAAQIKYRIRIKLYINGDAEAHVRTHQGKSLAKKMCSNVVEAGIWADGYIKHREAYGD